MVSIPDALKYQEKLADVLEILKYQANLAGVLEVLKYQENLAGVPDALIFFCFFSSIKGRKEGNETVRQ